MSHLHISPLFQSATITAITNNNLSSIESLKDVLQNILLLSNSYLLEACHPGFADGHLVFQSGQAMMRPHPSAANTDFFACSVQVKGLISTLGSTPTTLLLSQFLALKQFSRAWDRRRQHMGLGMISTQIYSDYSCQFVKGRDR